MINTAKQLKDLIRNLSKKKSADACASMDIDATIKGTDVNVEKHI